MENNTFRSFEDYLEAIKMVVKNNCKENNEIGRSLREIHFLENEVDANFEYFRECYDGNESPEYVISNLRYNENDLFRKIDNITNECILSEVNERYLIDNIISQADTDDLEYELKERWDSNLVNLYDVDDTDLIDELVRRGQYSAFGKKATKSIICEALGFSNSFAFSKEEIITEIEKLF